MEITPSHIVIGSPAIETLLILQRMCLFVGGMSLLQEIDGVNGIIETEQSTYNHCFSDVVF